jgi:hypothetical protein
VKINHKLLRLLEGKCFHEWERIDKPPNNYVRETKYMCSKCYVVDDYPFENVDSPGYSSPNIYMPFLQWFWKENREMWDAFLSVHPFAWDGKAIPYLFSLTDEGEPRVMVLLSEWLTLPETRYAWGESKCPNEYCENGQVLEGDHHVECGVCNGTGRVKAEWAKEVKDAD